MFIFQRNAAIMIAVWPFRQHHLSMVVNNQPQRSTLLDVASEQKVLFQLPLFVGCFFLPTTAAGYLYALIFSSITACYICTTATFDVWCSISKINSINRLQRGHLFRHSGSHAPWFKPSTELFQKWGLQAIVMFRCANVNIIGPWICQFSLAEDWRFDYANIMARRISV